MKKLFSPERVKYSRPSLFSTTDASKSRVIILKHVLFLSFFQEEVEVEVEEEEEAEEVVVVVNATVVVRKVIWLEIAVKEVIVRPALPTINL
jgi:poly(A) polymerase Pap1